MSSIYRSIQQFITRADSPEFLGQSTVKFNVAVLRGMRDSETQNLGDISFQPAASPGGFIIGPGETKIIRAPQKSFYRASSFRIQGANVGDGVVGHYTLASWKTFNNVEMKLEQAIHRLLRTIAATLDDTSITTGISDEEREPNSIVAYVSGGTEWNMNTGTWVLETEIIIRSDCDVENARTKHHLRTAYVRDLLMDSQVCELLSALEYNLTVFHTEGPATIASEIDEEGRKWVSRFAKKFHVAGSVIDTDDAEDSADAIGDVHGEPIGDVSGEPILDP